MKLRSFIACGLMAAAVSAGETSHYTAHEWGTFTSVQGSDGQPIPWNPFTESDLPNFVHTRRKPADGPAVRAQAVNLRMLMSKETTHWFQRMETPVIYFHSAKPLRLTATVELPNGLITEWYPAATAYGPVFGVTNLLPEASQSFATWTDLEILPRDAASNGTIPNPPKESAASHYYAARNAQSNPVRTTRGVGLTTAGRGESEHFVFYRGVADFTSPLKVSNPGQELLLENTGRHDLASLFVWEARGNKASLTPIPSLAVGTVHHAEQDPNRLTGDRSTLTRQFKDRLQTALVADGLNADEASAMIQTWADSWFDEDGTRVLYLVPRAFTDSVLPLTLQPAPTTLARVFVGRAELIPADLERRAESLAERFHKSGDKSAAQELGKLVVPRFADSLLNRLHSRDLAASENWLSFEPSLEPIEKRREAATVKRNERFSALRAAVFPKQPSESASLPAAGSIFSTAATATP